ncbi:MAG: hypothetical protein JWO52_4184 [Gammaproteobacteria bacterium]|nr:hypothetical protein [Gammaproteobacteria bacterium]
MYCMYSALLADTRLYGLLKKCDEDLAGTAKAAGCPYCEGVLHSARFLRKPRGAPAELGLQEHWRLSFCCAAEGCRKRTTPPSLCFLGRRVYLATAVVLISVMRCGATPVRVQRLQDLVGVSRRTVLRWQTWWRCTLPQSPFWRSARGSLSTPVTTTDLPLSLLERFVGDAELRVRGLLRFVGPLTGGKGV